MNSMPIVNVIPQEPQATAPEQKLAVPKEDAGKFDLVLSAHASKDVPKVSVQKKVPAQKVSVQTQTEIEGGGAPVSKGKPSVSFDKGRGLAGKRLEDNDLTALMVFLGVLGQQLQQAQDTPGEMSGGSERPVVKHLLKQFAGKGAGESWSKGDINEQIDSLTANLSALVMPEEIFGKNLDSVMETLTAFTKDQDAGLQDVLVEKLQSLGDAATHGSVCLPGSLLKELKNAEVSNVPSQQSDQEGVSEAVDMSKGAVLEDKPVFMQVQFAEPKNDHMKGPIEKSDSSEEQVCMSPKMDGHTHGKAMHEIQDSAGGDVGNSHLASAPMDRGNNNLKKDTDTGNPDLMVRVSSHGLQEEANQPAEYSGIDFKPLDKAQRDKHAKGQRFGQSSRVERLSAQQGPSNSVNNGAAVSGPSVSENRSGEHVLIVDFRPDIRHETDSVQTEKVLNRIPGQSDVLPQPSSSSMHGNFQEMKAGYAVDTAKGGAFTDTPSRIGVLDQISQGIHTAVAMNRNRAVIHLNPPELGSVTIRLHVDHNNHVHASFLTEHVHTHQLLESGMESLRQQLGHNGFDLGQVNVNVGGGGMHDTGTSRREQSDRERHGFEEMIRDDEIDTEITAPVSSAGLSGPAGGVHIIM